MVQAPNIYFGYLWVEIININIYLVTYGLTYREILISIYVTYGVNFLLVIYHLGNSRNVIVIV